MVCMMLFAMLGCQPVTRFSILEDKAGVLVSEGNKPVLFYQTGKQLCGEGCVLNNFIHPLYGPSGDTLTEKFPADHPHHRGIFWAWHQVLIEDQPMGDPWLGQDFTWDIQEVTHDRDRDYARIGVVNYWKSPHWKDVEGHMQAMAQEEVEVIIYPQKNRTRVLDVKIHITSLVDELRIGGSDDIKGYGGFSTRLELPEDVWFRGPAGILHPTKQMVEAGGWVYLGGTYGDDEQKGVLLMAHPDNPGDPRQWILRKEKSMQNAVYPGRNTITLHKGDSFCMKYRMVLHEGVPDQISPTDLYREYQSNEELNPL